MHIDETAYLIELRHFPWVQLLFLEIRSLVLAILSLLNEAVDWKSWFLEGVG
jgi:hypothetical protein